MTHAYGALVGRRRGRARGDGHGRHGERPGTRRAGGIGPGGPRPARAGRRHLPRRQPGAADVPARAGTDPLAIPAGDHLVEIRAAGAAATETPLLTQTVTVPAGFAGLADRPPRRRRQPDADGVRRRPLGRAGRAGPRRRAPRRGGRATSPSCSTTSRRSPTWRPRARRRRVVAAGAYQVAGDAGAPGGAPLATPQDVQFAEGTANFMYLIGSQADGTLGWAAVAGQEPADGTGDDPDR